MYIDIREGLFVKDYLAELNKGGSVDALFPRDMGKDGETDEELKARLYKNLEQFKVYWKASRDLDDKYFYEGAQRWMFDAEHKQWTFNKEEVKRQMDELDKLRDANGYVTLSNGEVIN